MPFPAPWNYPPLSLLEDRAGGKADRGDTKTNAAIIERTLDSFGIGARVAEVNKLRIMIWPQRVIIALLKVPEIANYLGISDEF